MITSFHWPGTPQDQNSDADVLGVGPNFFETLHIPFLAGREFNASDFKLSASNSGATPTSAPTPVIVNQAFVEKYRRQGKSDRETVRRIGGRRKRPGESRLRNHRRRARREI